ncbi:hypothetical protein Dimus_022454 [Dionaea muscipula]
MWSYDSSKHGDLRVRSVEERMMREGLGSVEEDLRSNMTDLAVMVVPSEDLAPFEIIDPDLRASTEGFSLTMADALPDLDDGGRLPVHLSDDSVVDGAPEKRVVDGEELQESAVGPDVLSSPYFSVSAPSSSRFAGLQGAAAEDGGCGAVESAVGADVVLSSRCFSVLESTAMSCSASEVTGVAAAVCAGESQATTSSLVCIPLSSRSQWSPYLVCAGEQGTGVVGDGVEKPDLVELGVGGDGGEQEVEVGVGGDAHRHCLL